MSDYTHVIDWDKVDDVKDVIEILKGLDITVDPNNINERLLKYIKPISEEYK